MSLGKYIEYDKYTTYNEQIFDQRFITQITYRKKQRTAQVYLNIRRYR